MIRIEIDEMNGGENDKNLIMNVSFTFQNPFKSFQFNKQSHLKHARIQFSESYFLRFGTCHARQ